MKAETRQTAIALFDTLCVVAFVMAFATILIVLLSGCAKSNEPPACAPDQLAKIEAAYSAEVLAACAGQTYDSCAALPAIEAKYQQQREGWIQCR